MHKAFFGTFRRFYKVFSVVAIGALLLTGCTLNLPSAPSNTVDSESGIHVANSQLPLVKDAFAKSTDIQRYGLKGTVSTTANNFTKTVSLYGHVANPDQFVINEVVDGRSYMMIQTADQTYVRSDNKWARTDRIDKSFNLFGSIASLSDHIKTLNQLNDDTIVSTPTYVFQFDANANDIASALQGQIPAQDQQINNFPVQYTVWIGKKDHLIYQIRMQWSHAVPSLGNVAEDATFMFFDLNKNYPITVSKDIIDQVNQIPGMKNK